MARARIGRRAADEALFLSGPGPDEFVTATVLASWISRGPAADSSALRWSRESNTARKHRFALRSVLARRCQSLME